MKKKKENNAEISNVTKLIIICALTIIAVLLLRNWYIKNQQLSREVPILENVLTHQIKSNELHNYVNDTSSAVIYICASNNDTCRELESEMKPFIKKNSLEDTIIYLDLKEVSNVSSFYQELNNTYSYTPSISEYPTILYFENATLKNALNSKEMNIKKIEEFLKGLQLIG